MPSRALLLHPLVVRLGLLLGRILPLRVGYWTGDRLGALVASRRSADNTRAVRANQWVVGGGALSPAELERRTEATFRAFGRCLYDFYHYRSDLSALQQRVEISPSFRRCIDSSRLGRAQFLVNSHFSNFDLVGIAAVRAGLRMQVLSFAQPPAGYRIQNDLRVAAGMEVTPISTETMRQALARLRGGGTVLTSADRPMPGPALPLTKRPLFFGRPANLPNGYLRLAISAGVPIVVVSGQTLADGRYRLWASEPLSPPRASDPESAVTACVETILEIIAQSIRRTPEQWGMFYPVWPEALAELPD